MRDDDIVVIFCFIIVAICLIVWGWCDMNTKALELVEKQKK